MNIESNTSARETVEARHDWIVRVELHAEPFLLAFISAATTHDDALVIVAHALPQTGAGESTGHQSDGVATATRRRCETHRMSSTPSSMNPQVDVMSVALGNGPVVGTRRNGHQTGGRDSASFLWR